VDNATSSSADATSLTWSHAVGTGSSRLLIVGVSVRDTTKGSATGVTYGGTSLTLIGRATNGTTVETTQWYLLNPTSGTANVVVTLSAAAKVVAGPSRLPG